MKIEIKILNEEFYTDNPQFEPGYELPSYSTPGSAAMDLICTEDVTIHPGEVKAIHTGLAIWIASSKQKFIDAGKDPRLETFIHSCWDYTGLIMPRSGLGTKGLVLANTIGVIDEDYQGELIVQAWNRNEQIKYSTGGYPLDSEIKKIHNNRPDEYYKVIELKAGDRFAQLMFVPVIRAQWEVVNEFSSKTERGAGGFGHTG